MSAQVPRPPASLVFVQPLQLAYRELAHSQPRAGLASAHWQILKLGLAA
jgi:hypothetical protein